jgi:hypothetical protein
MESGGLWFMTASLKQIVERIPRSRAIPTPDRVDHSRFPARQDSAGVPGGRAVAPCAGTGQVNAEKPIWI